MHDLSVTTTCQRSWRHATTALDGNENGHIDGKKHRSYPDHWHPYRSSVRSVPKADTILLHSQASPSHPHPRIQQSTKHGRRAGLWSSAARNTLILQMASVCCQRESHVTVDITMRRSAFGMAAMLFQNPWAHNACLDNEKGGVKRSAINATCGNQFL